MPFGVLEAFGISYLVIVSLSLGAYGVYLYETRHYNDDLHDEYEHYTGLPLPEYEYEYNDRF